ncbi:GldG family protein [Flavonifractor plautii]|nr:GldG family protein [Flavonifractor plautii]
MKKRPNATPSGPAGHSRQAFQGGTYSLMLTAAVLALLIVLNLLVSALPTNLTQYDISASKLYSVTSNTKVVVNALEQDVTIYWIVQSGEEDAVIENLLGKYESLSDHITVVKKNPDVYPTFAEQYTDETVKNNSLVVECGERSRFISYDDIYLSEPDMYTYSYNTSFDGEGAITSAIDYVVNAEQPQLYRLEGHGESELPSTFQDQLEKANMELHDLSLLTVDAIPEDAACLLIYAPTSDISGEERDMLADYVTGGGKLLVMAYPVDGASLDNLYSLLSKYGVTANEGIVIESDREHYAFQAPFALLPDLASSAITDSLIDERYFPILPLSLGLTVGRTPTAPQSPPAHHLGRLLQQAGTTSWTPTTRRRGSGRPLHPGGLRGVSSGQMVWFSSSAFLDDKYNALSSGANVNLGMNALSSLVGRARPWPSAASP